MDINYAGAGNVGQGRQQTGQAGASQPGSAQAGADQTGQQQQPYILDGEIATKLFLIGTIMNNLNVTKKDSIYIIAGIIIILANIFITKAAFEEAQAQQIAPGQTTFANQLKMSGTSIALIAALILFWALIIETNLKAQGLTPTTTPVPAVGGVTGAITGGA